MTILDMFEIWQIKTGSDSRSAFFAEAEIDDRIDRDILCNTIVARWGFASPLITESESFFYLSNNWINAHHEDFKRVIDALYSTYSPIENYDRIEERTTDDVLSSAYDDTKNETSNSDESAKSETETKVSAFNSDVYQPSNDSTRNDSVTEKKNTILNGAGTKTDDRVVKENIRAHGNIGVTTSQQMIESELSLRMNNIYNMIADMWSRDLTLSIY